MYSFKQKMIVIYILVLIVFMCITLCISFTISKNVVLKSVVEAKENEVIIFADYMHDMYNDLYGELSLFAGDVQTNEIMGNIDDSNYGNTIKAIDNFNEYFRPILYSNDCFQSIYYIKNNSILGISLQGNTYSRKIMSTDITKYEGSLQSKQKLIEYLKEEVGELGEINPQEMIVIKIEDQAYLIGILNLQKIIEKKNRNVTLIDQNKNIIYTTIKDDVLKNYIYGIHRLLDNGFTISKSMKQYIVSGIREESGISYVLLFDMGKLFMEFKTIIKIMLLSSVLLCISFIIVAYLYCNIIIKPVKEFSKILDSVNDFGKDISFLKEYIHIHKNKKSIYRSILLLLSIIIIPLLISITISYFSFRTLIYDNTYKTYCGVVEQISQNIDYKISRYKRYMRYLIFDRKLQKILMETIQNTDYLRKAEDYDFSISNILFNKGLLEKGVTGVRLFDSDNRLVFKTSYNLIDSEFCNIAYETRGKEIDMKVTVMENGSEKISFIGQINYLPQNTDKSNFFKKLGYLEIYIENFLYDKLNLIYPNTKFTSYIIAEESYIMADYGGKKYDINKIGDVVNFRQTYDYSYDIELLNNNKTLLIQYPISSNSDLVMVSFVKIDILNKDSMTVIIYNAALLIALFIFIKIVSRILGNKLLINIHYLEDRMEKVNIQNNILISKNDNDKYEYEFVKLAKSFDKMLKRLEYITNKLRIKEIENAELDKRRHKTQLIALQSQIKPHFLHNIIASIIILLKNSDVEKAIRMLVSTGRFYKFSLYGTEEMVTLGKEVFHTKHYVEIEKIRYGNKLEYKDKIDEKYYGCFIPKFILQPLVENAIVHGMREEQVLSIQIECSPMDDGSFKIYIRDNGRGIPGEKLKTIKEKIKKKIDTDNYGLSNVNERIQLQFGEKYGLTLKSIMNRETVVIVKIPYIKKGGDACLTC